MKLWLQIALVSLVSASACKSRNQVKDATPSLGFSSEFLKGQTHVHTGNSGDSATPVGEVVKFYEDSGFDFIVITDHNFITKPIAGAKMLVFAGSELTQNYRTCEPPPEPGMGCLLHINGLFLGGEVDVEVRFGSPTDLSRAAIYQRAIDETKKRGGIAQLNHPNMGWAASASLVAALAGRGVALIEIANQNELESNRGDATHPSTEALWDEALGSSVIWGVATDDAHHYSDAAALRARGQDAFVGNLGWIMVRAERTETSIREAITAGDFYSSTGIELTSLEAEGGALSIAIRDDGSGPFVTTFIGDGGKTLAEVTGTKASYTVSAGESRYVRARVENRRGQKAWTQPSFR